MSAPAPRIVNMDEPGEIEVTIDQLGVSAAEVNQQIATAKKYPRSIERFRASLLSQVTLTEEIAASCYYMVPRDGKDIEGPSTRLAEMALSAWGNCRATARIVAETENFIVAQGIFIDLERNVAVGVEVNRRIVDKYGQRFKIDMIGVTAAAAMSIALRNAIFRGIPRVFIDEAYEAAKATVAGKLATLSDKRNRMLEAFKAYGITEAQILAKMGKEGMAEIGERELTTLRGYLSAIKGEETDPSDIFAPAQSGGQSGGQSGAPPERQAAPKPASDVQSKSESSSGGGSAGADAPVADGGAGGQGQAPPADHPRELSELELGVAQALLDCRTKADCDGVFKLFQKELADERDPAVRASVNAMIEDRANALAQARGAEPDGEDFPGDRPARGGR